MADVRPYQPQDLAAVADLYRRAYRGDLARRRQAFEWIHEHNPRPDPDAVYLLWWEDEQVAGYLGRSPVRLFIGGRAVPAVYSQEALVDPALRGRGVATTLFEVTNRTARPMISLWHNERIVSLLGKTGWTRVGPLPSMRKYYRMDRLAPTRFRAGPIRAVARVLGRIHRWLTRAAPPAIQGYAIEPVARFGEEFDDLAHIAASQQGVIADRGADVLRWKYAAIPHQRYHCVAVRRNGRLRAYGVLLVQEGADGIRKGKVVDLLGDATEPEAMDALAVYCDGFFREADVDLAACIVAPERFQRSFRRIGFRRAKPTLTSWLWIRNQMCVPEHEGAALNRIETWYITLGDSDSEMW